MIEIEEGSANFMRNPLSSSTMNMTVDSLFGGKIMVVQERDGYRFSLDAVLLAGFIWLKKEERVIDLGTGVGIIPLILAARGERIKEIIGVEIQEELTALAEKNVSLNHFDDRISIIRGNIKELRGVFLPSTFDVVMTNPPYFRVSSGRINNNSQKVIARHEMTCTISDTLEMASFLLKKGGRVFVIFPAHRSITLVYCLRSVSLEPKRIRWVHSRDGEGAKFILVEAHKEGGEGLEVMTPLIVYTADGKYTPEMERFYTKETIVKEGGQG